MSKKHLVLSNKDYELTKMLVRNIVFFYEKDLEEYQMYFDSNDYTTFNKETVLEEIEFLTTEIRRTNRLLVNLDK